MARSDDPRFNEPRSDEPADPNPPREPGAQHTPEGERGGVGSRASRTSEERRPVEDPPPRQDRRAAEDPPPRHDEVRASDHTFRDSFIGTDRGEVSSNNSSWGAIIAGTVTFLALMLVFGLISAALGLTDVGGAAVGIWSIVALLIALAAAGFVAGALAVRGGLLHGLVTWATSLVGIVLLVGWLGAGVLGAAGGALGNVAQTAVEETDVTVEELEQQVDVDQEELEQAQQEAEEAAEEHRAETAEAAWWTVGGLLVGAVVAGLGGLAGARSAHVREVGVETTHPRR